MSQHGILRSLLLPALAAGAIGCGDPPIDSNTPEPAGVMEGTVLYAGPPPTCEYDQDTGEPIRAHGRAVILLFEYDNPPPPEGSATTAVNLLVVPGSSLFTDPWNDCPPVGTTPSGVVQRSVGFTWPELPLGQGHPVRYRAQGFYDRDEDFNPFFNITQAPTAGDIAGAAVDDAQAANPQPVPIEFGAAEDFPNGELVGGVTVSLGLPVNTDPPIFYVSTDPLRAEQSTVLVANPIQNEQNILALTNTTLHLYDDLESPRGVDLREALEAAAFDYALGPNRPEYAWYVRGVDVDGVPGADPHPILDAPGVAEYQWLTPLVLLQRIQSSVETEAGIPNVLLIPALPNQDTAEATSVAEGDVLFPDLRIGIPPVGVIVTNPEYDVCRVATFGPSSTKELYDGASPDYRGVLGDCQEIPTGRYAFNVLQGLMAGVPTADVASPTGWNIMGGRFSSQSWTIPNPLGSPEQFVPSGSDAPLGCEPTNPGDPDPSSCISDQGVASTFLIYDDVPESYVSRRAGDMSCLEGPSALSGVSTGYQFRDFQAGDVADFVAAREDDAFVTNEDVQAVCCEPIAHLCDVPLCGTVEDPFAPGHFVRASPTTVTEVAWGAGETRMRPDCVPFLMPTACCSTPTP
jgi:hypothetical protein